jgi:hypothetical protein
VNWYFHQAAREEFFEAIGWYEGRKPGLGDEFLHEVNQSIQRIRAKPESFRRLSAETRVCRTARFPYLIIYRIRAEIEIVAVMHARRKPGYWKERL